MPVTPLPTDSDLLFQAREARSLVPYADDADDIFHLNGPSGNDQAQTALIERLLARVADLQTRLASIVDWAVAQGYEPPPTGP